MVRIKTNNNLINKKDVSYLLSSFSINDIESALIENFLVENKINKVDNKFINSFIKETDETKKIKDIAMEMGLGNLYRFNNLVGTSNPLVSEQLAKATLNNVDFYIDIAARQRAEQISFLDKIKYSSYYLLDKLV